MSDYQLKYPFEQYREDVDMRVEDYNAMDGVSKGTIRKLWNEEAQSRALHRNAMEQANVKRTGDYPFEQYLKDVDSSLEEYIAMDGIRKATMRNLWNEAIRTQDLRLLAMEQQKKQQQQQQQQQQQEYGLALQQLAASAKERFAIPSNIVDQKHHERFHTEFLDKVNMVNHNEFEETVEALMEAAAAEDEGAFHRPYALAIQRCRRGGKTFMLHAVASMLEDKTRHTDALVVCISMHNQSSFESTKEDAQTAVLSRIAWALIGREGSFDNFRDKYDFSTIKDWLVARNVFLLIDELNVIPHTAKDYQGMSDLLHALVARKGSSLLYSTHHRDTKDWLRGRSEQVENQARLLALRHHKWMKIPRIKNKDCLLGLVRNANSPGSLWSAVLRGRLPALVVLSQAEILSYADEGILGGDKDEGEIEETRKKCLTAAITGSLGELPSGRGLFRAYSYMSDRAKSKPEDPYFAWPPFMLAQETVLGKNYGDLRNALEHPNLDEAKAFEALTQLAVLLRLLTDQTDDPYIPNAPAGMSNAWKQTEMFHISDEATSIEDVIEFVQGRYSPESQGSGSEPVLQVVAVPLHGSFPMYDFFILKRENAEGQWVAVAGYQCKKGSKYPEEKPDDSVSMSVWLEGKPPQYHVDPETNRHVQVVDYLGWTLFGKKRQSQFLGVSVSEALPPDEEHGDGKCCPAAEKYTNSKQPAAKKPRTEHTSTGTGTASGDAAAAAAAAATTTAAAAAAAASAAAAPHRDNKKKAERESYHNFEASFQQALNDSMKDK